ncbi:MAG: hypothetical protein WCJ35_24245 [Planctomycetota bacterium]
MLPPQRYLLTVEVGDRTIKPSDSENIAQAEVWLVKRKWRAW